MKSMSKIAATLFAAMMVMGLTVGSAAAEGAKNKVVIQVSSADEATQNLALNNVVNVQNEFGIDNVDIEVVAYGPGLSLLTQGEENKAAARVTSLAKANITFSACGNTIKAVEKKTGKAPELLAGVRVVPAGVIRIMELQSQGYAYIRP